MTFIFFLRNQLFEKNRRAQASSCISYLVISYIQLWPLMRHGASRSVMKHHGASQSTASWIESRILKTTILLYVIRKIWPRQKKWLLKIPYSSHSGSKKIMRAKKWILFTAKTTSYHSKIPPLTFLLVFFYVKTNIRWQQQSDIFQGK